MRSSKDTVEDVRSIDADDFQRAGLFCQDAGLSRVLSWGSNGHVGARLGYTLLGVTGITTAVQLTYTATHWEEKKHCDYPVLLTSTTCLGECRWWFICPLWHNGVKVGSSLPHTVSPFRR